MENRLPWLPTLFRQLMFKGSTNNAPNEECSRKKRCRPAIVFPSAGQPGTLLPKAPHHVSSLTFLLFLCAADAILLFTVYLIYTDPFHPAASVAHKSYGVFPGSRLLLPTPADLSLRCQPQERGTHPFPKTSTTCNTHSDPKTLDLLVLPPCVTISAQLHRSAESGSWVRMMSS